MSAQAKQRLHAALGFVFLFAAASVAAAPFTPGNIVVYRVGAGSVGLVATGSPIFLDEYTPGGAKVQSLPLPIATIAGTTPLQRGIVASGTATTDGLLTRSTDGTCLIVPGYARDLSVTTGNLTSTTGVARGVARVLASGAIDTSTALTDASLGSNFRSATSDDCSRLWVSGAAGTTAPNNTGGGVRFATVGASTSADLTAATFATTRTVLVQGGQLYVSSGVSNLRNVATIGSGTPTTGPQTVTRLPGLPNGSSGTVDAFFLAQLNPASSGLDTLYTADEDFGIQKYSLVSGAWVLNGTAGAATDLYRGIAGIVSGTTVTIFATRKGGSGAAGGGEFVSLIDAGGYNKPFAGVPTILATAATNTAFRGVALAPVAPPPPKFNVTPSISGSGTITPANVLSISQGATAQFDVAPAAGFQVSMGGTCNGVLAGLHYTTAPITADCTVVATFTSLPHYNVTPSAGPNGTISPSSPVDVVSGGSASFSITPAAGYNAAIRGTCGGGYVGDMYVTGPVSGNCTLNVTFARKLVLFVGNSYTFGRADPVMSYNAANVTDLTNQMWLDNPDGSNDDEPHPWGGIPGIFKKMTDEANLEYDVSISARNAATLRGHYLNSNPAGWDLRDNVATQRYDIVMLQDQSDEPLPVGRGANANLPFFDAYVDKLEQWVHQGLAQNYTETQLIGLGSTATCQGLTGNSASQCDKVQVITPANPNARADAQVYLYETWARPDMIGPNGNDADGQFYTGAEGIEAMTQDLHNAYFGRAVANGHIEDVAPVGDAFLRAVQDGIAMRDPYVPDPTKLDLWYIDFFHPSKYGSYLSAAVHFATLTGINPLTLGADEQAAADLGIAPADAVNLQRMAQKVVAADVTPPTTQANASPPPDANGFNRDDVTVSFTASDNGPNLSGLDKIHYTLGGAQSGSGTFDTSGSIVVTAEGVTTVTYYSTDRAGNAETARSLPVSIDRSAPVTTLTASPAANANGWNRDNVTVSFAATDNVSGVDKIHYTLSGAQSGSGALDAGASLTITAEGVTTVAYYATDRAGNTEAVRTSRVAIDRSAPTTVTALSTPPNAAGWNNADVTVTLTATDNPAGLSGLDAIHYTLTGAQAATGTLGASGTVAVTAEGVTTLTYAATDRAGNTETTHTLRIAIDRTGPVIDGMPAAACSVWPPNKKMVTIATISASAVGAGLASFEVSGTSSEAPSSAGQADVQVVGSGLAPRVVLVRADRAGNGSGRVYTITAIATDAAGNSTTAVGTCTVPHDQGK